MKKTPTPGAAEQDLPPLPSASTPQAGNPTLDKVAPRELRHPVRLQERGLARGTEMPALTPLTDQLPALQGSAFEAPRRPEAPFPAPKGLSMGVAATELPALSEFAARERPEAPTKGPESARGTGTTTVGITTKDACVLATDHRATAGHLISHMDTQKLFRIDGHLGMTIAGLVGDAQDLVRTLQAQAKLFSMKENRPMPVRAAAAYMANHLNQKKFTPFEVALIIGGFDDRGAQVFSLDEAGGSIPDKWTTTGSGSRFVYGVLEDRYVEGLTSSDAVDLAIRGLNAATHRDSASGNGFDAAIINKNGFQWVPREETERRLKKMGLPAIPK